MWRDAATPTRAAAADEAAKLVGAGILPADSSITLSRLGLSKDQQAVLREELANRPASDVQILAEAIARQQTTA